VSSIHTSHNISNDRGRLVSDLAVVHLVRKANGEEPLRRFLRSYKEHPAGVEHDLVLLMKGFESDAEAANYRRLAEDLSSCSINVSDEGYDLTAYVFTANELSHKRLCFVNSFSLILVDNWLALLTNACDRPDVGLVGATGSWGSQLSHIRFDLGLGGVYAQVYDDRVETQRRLREIAADAQGPKTRGGKLKQKAQTAQAIIRRCVSFEAFPAHHVRTNGFLIDSEVMRRIRVGRQRDKLDAFRLESGRRSITRQVQSMGLHAVIVGRDGSAYCEPEWDQSNTFWQGDQENLIIADNQTVAYRDADLDRRTILSQFAWGPSANPSSRQTAISK
jgi:hypothetical protein